MSEEKWNPSSSIFDKCIKANSDIKEMRLQNSGMIYSLELWLSSLLKSYKMNAKEKSYIKTNQPINFDVNSHFEYLYESWKDLLTIHDLTNVQGLKSPIDKLMPYSNLSSVVGKFTYEASIEKYENSQIILYNGDSNNKYVLKRVCNPLDLSNLTYDLLRKIEKRIECSFNEFGLLKFFSLCPHSAAPISFNIIQISNPSFLLTEIFMEYAGDSLFQSQIKNDSYYLFECLYQLSCILKYLEEFNILHNDIKESNIMISRIDDLIIFKLIDFDIGHFLKFTDIKKGSVKIKGFSEYYESPEVLLHLRKTKNDLDLLPIINHYKSQIFSMGVVLLRQHGFFENFSIEDFQKYKLNKEEYEKYFIPEVNTFEDSILDSEIKKIFEIVKSCINFNPEERLSGAELFELLSNFHLKNLQIIQSEYKALIRRRKYCCPILYVTSRLQELLPVQFSSKQFQKNTFDNFNFYKMWKRYLKIVPTCNDSELVSSQGAYIDKELKIMNLNFVRQLKKTENGDELLLFEGPESTKYILKRSLIQFNDENYKEIDNFIQEKFNEYSIMKLYSICPYGLKPHSFNIFQIKDKEIFGTEMIIDYFDKTISSIFPIKDSKLAYNYFNHLLNAINYLKAYNIKNNIIMSKNISIDLNLNQKGKMVKFIEYNLKSKSSKLMQNGNGESLHESYIQSYIPPEDLKLNILKNTKTPKNTLSKINPWNCHMYSLGVLFLESIGIINGDIKSEEINSYKSTKSKYQELILKLENYIKSQNDPILKNLIKLSVYCLDYNSDNRPTSNELIKISKNLHTKNPEEIEREYLNLIDKRKKEFRPNKKHPKLQNLENPGTDYSVLEIDIPQNVQKDSSFSDIIGITKQKNIEDELSCISFHKFQNSYVLQVDSQLSPITILSKKLLSKVNKKNKKLQKKASIKTELNNGIKELNNQNSQNNQPFKDNDKSEQKSGSDESDSSKEENLSVEKLKKVIKKSKKEIKKIKKELEIKELELKHLSKKYSDDIEKLVSSYEYKMNLIKSNLEQKENKIKQLSSPKRLVDSGNQISGNESEITISKDIYNTLKNYEHNCIEISTKFEQFIHKFRELDLLTIHNESYSFFEYLDNLLLGYKQLKDRSIHIKSGNSPNKMRLSGSEDNEDDQEEEEEEEKIEEENQPLKPKRGKVYGVEGPFPFFGVKYQRNKNLYFGSFENGKYHGLGILFYNYEENKFRSYYCGNFKRGKKDGYGIKVNLKGDRYVGSWEKNKKTGVFFFSNISEEIEMRVYTVA